MTRLVSLGSLIVDNVLYTSLVTTAIFFAIAYLAYIYFFKKRRSLDSIRPISNVTLNNQVDTEEVIIVDYDQVIDGNNSDADVTTTIHREGGKDKNSLLSDISSNSNLDFSRNVPISTSSGKESLNKFLCQGNKSEEVNSATVSHEECESNRILTSSIGESSISFDVYKSTEELYSSFDSNISSDRENSDDQVVIRSRSSSRSIFESSGIEDEDTSDDWSHSL